MWIALIVTFILCSVITIPNTVDNFWMPKNAAFSIFGFILLGVNFITDKQRLNTLKNKWIGLVLIYLMLSFAYHFYLPLVLAKSGVKVNWNIWNYLPTLNIILSIFLIKDLVEYTDNLDRWVKIAKVLCWVAFVFSIYALLQRLGLDQIFTKDLKWLHGNKMITFMGNSMNTANFVAMISPLCLMFKDLKYKIFYAAIFLCLVFIDSTMSMAAFIIGLLAYLIMTKKTRLAVLIICGVILIGITFCYFNPSYLRASGRFELWRITLDNWILKPFTGHGLNSFAVKKYADHTSSVALFAESEFLQVLHDGGIFLFILVMGYLCGLAKKIILIKKNMLNIGYISGLLSYLIICVTNSPLWLAPTALVGIIYISALEAQTL
ncbi:MAG: O-antigen ligase family protein [Planctomycetota bacterium]|nr:O-antigen ligase family protein [Planctomycetota bacterium]